MLDFSIIDSAPVGFYLFGMLATLLVAISKAGFGGAMGALSLPLMLLALPPSLALSVLLPVFLLCDFYVGWKYYRRAIRRIVVVMTLAACLGQVAGWLLFKQINAEILTSIIGALAVFTAVRYFWRLYRPVENAGLARAALRQLRQRIDRALGWMGLAGIASFVSLTGGIPSQIYLLPLSLPRAYYVGTMGWSFLLVNLAKLPFFVELGLFDAASLTASLALAVFVPMGLALGVWLNRAMNDALFYHISHGFLLVLGVKVILQANI
ncbi:MAG: sulfite exporter TauE/SafE family protein [Pseudomonadota bacterium]|nr:sulfite exporter TauE/SafE family protein [Pseudomonadota bacterium]